MAKVKYKKNFTFADSCKKITITDNTSKEIVEKLNEWGPALKGAVLINKMGKGEWYASRNIK